MAKLQRAKPKPAVKKQCIGCLKLKKINARGLCQTCLKAAYRAIDSGVITEEKAIECGLILPRYDKTSPWMKRAKEVVAAAG